jgi:sulfoxide reductase heme-binding subunit YedZ
MLVDRINGLARCIPIWTMWLVAVMPVPTLLYQGFTGGLGREPIEALERELGEIALQLLIAGLCVTPLRRFVGINLLRFRRAIGLLAFTYVSLHLAVWLFLDVQVWSEIWTDIVKRPYVMIGMAAFLLMIPLALTSNNLSVRRLGAWWRLLHRLTYAISILGALHFIWLSKGFQIEPLIYLGLVLVLLALRAIPRTRAARAAT